MRGVTQQLGRLSLRREPAAAAVSVRTITTSTSSHAAVSSITTSVDAAPLIPLEERAVTATIHHFPSLEPLRFENFPANHLALPTRRDILHRAVVFEGDATRFGNANTKTRYEVTASRRKLRPQKGSGKARLGDRGSPMLVGGGRAHGPKPRDFSTGLQKKVYDLAWRTALSYRFRKGELVIVDNAMELESPSPSLLSHILATHRWGPAYGRSILVTTEERPLLAKAFAERPNSGWTLPWNEIDVKDMLSLGRVVIERSALKNLLLTHQDDIVRSKFPPKLQESLPPVELESIVGWPEYRALELAAPEEKEKLRRELYEHVAEQRIAEAEKYGEVEATRLLVSAYNLKSEVARLYAEELEQDPVLELEASEDDKERIKGLEKAIELLEMQATMYEYRAESLRLQGKGSEAEKWRAEAENCQDEAAATQIQIDEMLGVEPVEQAEQ